MTELWRAEKVKLGFTKISTKIFYLRNSDKLQFSLLVTIARSARSIAPGASLNRRVRKEER